MNKPSIPVFDRSTEEGDWTARQFFSPADLLLSPEEYIARHAHLVGCFALHRFRYRDAELGAWVRRVGELFFSENDIDRCRALFLTPAELEEVQRREAEGF
jgi:hypothetical protein